MSVLDEALLGRLDAALADDDAQRAARYPGGRTDRQPVHTVYVPADRFTPDLARRWGATALQTLDRHAPDPAAMAAVLGVPAAAVDELWEAVRAKLAAEPVEDLRVDLEDGYGTRPHTEEDGHAVAAGRALAAAVRDGLAPPYLGVRFKSLEGPTRRRGLRTLDLVLDALLAEVPLPAGWVVTLPKVTSVAQVAAMVEVCAALEAGHGLAEGTLRFEIQVETAQAVLGPDGTATVAGALRTASGRCSGLHFGTYDYTAALGIAGSQQALDHPSADHAKAVLQLAAAQTGVWVSDGSTNLVPVGEQADVHAGWERHHRLVRRSLERGFYQGWDLHPAQLPTRFLATFGFFRTDLARTGARLRAYLSGTDAGVMDEPATAQALATFCLRGLHCGAVTATELTSLTNADPTTLTTLVHARGHL